MIATEREQREAVLAEARSWLRTPYHHHANVKGAGVDCAYFVMECYAAAGLANRIEPGHYPPDWFMHRGEERYLSQVLAQAREFSGPPQPADLVMFKIGRLWAHGAVVVEWPVVIHACSRARCVTLAEADRGELGERQRRYFTLWGNA